MIDVHMSRLLLLFRKMFAEETEQFAPRVHALFGPVERPVPIEEAMAGTVVAMKLVRLAVFLQLDLVLVHLFGARRAVVIAEDADQRAAEVPGHVDWRNRRLGVELLLAHDHAAAPELGTGIDVLPLARIDEGMTAARTGAEYAD